VRAGAIAVTTQRVWTPWSDPATLMTTRRERDHVPAWERVECKRGAVRPRHAEARVAGALTSWASLCNTALLVRPVPERRWGWASIHAITAGEAQ
jgi:hypothetical protein